MRRQQVGFFGLEGLALYAVIGLAIALALTVAGSGAAIWYLDGKVDKANKAATEAAEARASEEQSRKGFQAAAASCTASVERLVAAGDRRDRLWAAQLGVSAAQTERSQAEANEIRARQRPAGVDECTAMKKELDDEVDRRLRRTPR